MGAVKQASKSEFFLGLLKHGAFRYLCWGCVLPHPQGRGRFQKGKGLLLAFERCQVPATGAVFFFLNSPGEKMPIDLPHPTPLQITLIGCWTKGFKEYTAQDQSTLLGVGGAGGKEHN